MPCHTDHAILPSTPKKKKKKKKREKKSTDALFMQKPYCTQFRSLMSSKTLRTEQERKGRKAHPFPYLRLKSGYDETM
jgi:hypothetical protein